MLKCFEEGAAFELQDKLAFKLRHRFAGHPTLSLAHLCRFIPSLPETHVHYSKGLLQTSDDFDQTPYTHPNGLSIAQTIENMRTVDSYIMIRQPEIDPDFAEFKRDLVGDLQELVQRRGWGHAIVNPKLYLFVSSPNSITPFHIDRASNFLMQVSGTKTVTVFKPWDERVVTPEETERRMGIEKNPTWKPETAALGQPFELNAGDALHIPFVAGHHVRNGAEEVSVSLSVFFNHRETAHRMRALMFNHAVRPSLNRMGLQPRPVGDSDLHDQLKSHTYRAASWMLRGLSGRG